jgi:hypothetical protein
MKQYTPPAQIKHTLYTQPGVTYAETTKQHFYSDTNVEQGPHTNQLDQQTIKIQDLRNMMKRLFEQMEIMLNLLTIVLTKLK